MEFIAGAEGAITIGQLFKAIGKLQKVSGAYGKNTQGYGYKYAELADVIASVKPHLYDCGLTIMQGIENIPGPDGKNGTVQVTTIIGHESGAYAQMKYALPPVQVNSKRGNIAQDYGAAITYAKRYSLVAMILGGEADDDAASLSQNKPEPRRDDRARHGRVLDKPKSKPKAKPKAKPKSKAEPQSKAPVEINMHTVVKEGDWACLINGRNHIGQPVYPDKGISWWHIDAYQLAEDMTKDGITLSASSAVFAEEAFNVLADHATCFLKFNDMSEKDPAKAVQTFLKMCMSAENQTELMDDPETKFIESPDKDILF